VRAARTGSGRTADELGRALPGVRILTSGRGGIVESVPDASCVVVATPGAEPFAAGGYAGVMLLDGDLLLDRADLRADEEALRRWSNAVALLGPRAAGAPVVLVADPSAPATQAMVRRDPVGFARERFDERVATHLPPAARLVTLTGTPVAVEEFVSALTLPAGAERLGPVPIEADPESEAMRVRIVLRVPLAAGRALAHALREAGAARSARKQEHVTLRVDPLRIEA
jgi:primosomal protein N' (replication factor Y)